MPRLHLVLTIGDNLEHSTVPVRSGHFLEQAVVDASQDELLAALPDLFVVHVLA